MEVEEEGCVPLSCELLLVPGGLAGPNFLLVGGRQWLFGRGARQSHRVARLLRGFRHFGRSGLVAAATHGTTSGAAAVQPQSAGGDNRGAPGGLAAADGIAAFLTFLL